MKEIGYEDFLSEATPQEINFFIRARFVSLMIDVQKINRKLDSAGLAVVNVQFINQGRL
jgi:hypothetical protein